MRKFDKKYNKGGKMELRRSQMALILELMRGETINQIAQTLNISFDSAQKRTKNLYKKFNVSSRRELAQVLIEKDIIATRQLSKKFRKRFPVKIEEQTIEPPIEELTEQELTYLSLASKATTKKNIIKQMKLRNMHDCNYIQACICRKLNALNMINALFIAGKLNLV